MQHLFYWAILFFSTLTLQANAQSEIPERILFVGNSYTYFWNLPQTVQAMAGAKDLPLETRQSTSGGTHWGHHWRGERSLTTKKLIEAGNFDAVVLQNHSRSALDRPDSLLYFGEQLHQLIRQHGGQTYLYLTWAREYDPYMQTEITEQYRKLAVQTNATLVPVGLAWQRARELRPGFPLYDDDGSHPSALGTYLTACVFYRVLTDQSPVGLPNRLTMQDQHGEKLYLQIHSAQNALFCQKVADEIASEVQEPNAAVKK